MANDQRRHLAIAVCVLLLGSLFVLGGADWPASPSPGLDLGDTGVDPADYAGEHVQTGGIVVDTNPVIIEIDADDPDAENQRLELENAPLVSEGQDVVVAGELTADGTLRVDPARAIVREPWEVAYMYGISALAALIVAGRGINGWRIDREARSLVPRDVPLHEQLQKPDVEAPDA